MIDKNPMDSLDREGPITEAQFLVLRQLFPDFGVPDDDLAPFIETEPARLLRSFFVFRISAVAVPDNVEDIQHFIAHRYRSVLVAAYRAEWTVLTAIVGSEAGISVFLGFRTKDERDPDPDVFGRKLRGLLPGLEALDTREELTSPLSYRGWRHAHGGIIAGIPILKVDDERTYLDFPSILRGMYGERYLLILHSRPVPRAEVQRQQRALWPVIDACHEGSRETVQVGESQSESSHASWSETRSKSVSTTFGLSLSTGIQAALGPLRLASGVGLSGSRTQGETKGEGRTEGKTRNRSENRSGTKERQDSLLLDIERRAEHLKTRLMEAGNIGLWETSITFATETKGGREVLAGLLLGELAAPNAVVTPPQVRYDETGDRPIIIPTRNGAGRLAAYLTSEELSIVSAPPAENLTGYDVRRSLALGLTDVRKPLPAKGNDSISIGENANKRSFFAHVCDHGHALDDVRVQLGLDDLAKHVFVCGLTGSGKTTTVKRMLADLATNNVPFLVLESAKRDYRSLFAIPALKDKILVYTPGDASIAPFRLNPFYVLPGVQVGVHIDYLKAIFNASFSLYGPMPYILERCLHNIYLKRGWDLTVGSHPHLVDPDGLPNMGRYGDVEARHYFPTLLDLRNEVERYFRDDLDYRGEVADNIRTAIIARLDSLTVGAKGQLFYSSEPVNVCAWLGRPTVLELETLSDDDDKAFLVGLLLTFISEYRQTKDASRDPWVERRRLGHVLVIEEAHRLLKNVIQERQTEQLGNPRGKAIEFFGNVISEMRSAGQGVIVVEQIPTKLLPDVISNTNTKVVHRLVSRDDQVLLAGPLGLEDGESRYLTSLKVGHAIYAKEGMQRPIEIKVPEAVASQRIGDKEVRGRYEDVQGKGARGADDDAGVMAIRSVLGRDGDAIAQRLLCTLACGEESDTLRDADKSVEEIGELLRCRERSEIAEAVRVYLANRVMELLANGDFCLSNGELRGMGAIVRRATDGDSEAACDLRQRLAEGWGQSAREGVVRRVVARAVHGARTAKIPVDDGEALRRHVTRYFIDPLDVRHEITAKVRARLGGKGWN